MQRKVHVMQQVNAAGHVRRNQTCTTILKDGRVNVRAVEEAFNKSLTRSNLSVNQSEPIKDTRVLLSELIRIIEIPW